MIPHLCSFELEIKMADENDIFRTFPRKTPDWMADFEKWWNRKLTLKCKLKCYVKPMKDPLGVSPNKGNQGTTRGKERTLLTSVGIEPTTSGLDLPLLCRLSYEVGQRSRRRLRW